MTNLEKEENETNPVKQILSRGDLPLKNKQRIYITVLYYFKGDLNFIPF